MGIRLRQECELSQLLVVHNDLDESQPSRRECNCWKLRDSGAQPGFVLRGGWSYGSKSLEKENLLVIRVDKEST